MPEEKAPDNSRQSVDLKWKSRKGIEENLAFEGSKTEVGGDLEVDGKIVLNSTSDLKTKDGGEGFVDLTSDQTIFGEKNFGKYLKVGGKGFGNTLIMSSGRPECRLSVRDWEHGASYLFAETRSSMLGFGADGFAVGNYHIYVRKNLTKDEQMAFTSDILPLYRHSVTLSDASASMVVFDYYSTNSTPIASASALYAALNGQQVVCNGAMNANGAAFSNQDVVIALKFGATKAASQGLILGTGSFVSFTQIFRADGEPTVEDSVSTVIAPVAYAKEDPWPDEEEAKGNAFPEEEEASPKAKKAVK